MDNPVLTHPEIMHGTPCFRGTRVPVGILFEYLAAGETVARFLEGFPSVSQEQALEVLKMASEQLQSGAAKPEPQREAAV